MKEVITESTLIGLLSKKWQKKEEGILNLISELPACVKEHTILA
jgi:hypothetical protein